MCPAWACTHQDENKLIENSDSKRSKTARRATVRRAHERSGMQRDGRRNTNGQRGSVRAMSVLGNAKSKSHRKTYEVEPGDTARKFTHLTRGDLPCESRGEVSRGRSSEESRGNPEGAKGRRTKRQANRLTAASEQEAHRNKLGAATAATSRHGGGRELWWTPEKEKRWDGRVRSRAEGSERRR